jgi:glutamate carboxypeptidase
MESFLAALVEQNSFTQHREGGNVVGRMLRERLAVADLACEVKPSQRFADHLVFRTRRTDRAVMLVGHLDTVFPPGVFEGYRRDGELARGPGVLDMKGGLVVMSWALLALDHVGALSELAVRMVVVSDEEVGSPEGQKIIADEAQSRAPEAAGPTSRAPEAAGPTHVAAGLVFEAGRAGDAIVTRRKGTGNVTVTARGRAAHAGNAHEHGVNAIWALARFVDRAQALTDYARGTTVSVGRIEGGHSRNTVPDSAKADFDIRFTSAEEGTRLMARLSAEAEAAQASVPGSRVEVGGGLSRLPLERTEASANLFAEYASCARPAGLGSAEAPLVGGGSDANTLAALGIPCIDALGPRGAGFHTVEERIEWASMVPKAEALVRFLLRAGARDR